MGTKPDLTFVTLVHQALRVDGARLLATVEALPPDDPAGRLPAVRARYAKYREQLVAHHTHEDTIFFPALAARVGPDEMHLDELVAQHDQLEGLLQEVEEALAALGRPDGDFAADRAEAAGAVAAMVEQLTAHLELEERVALPLFVSNMSVSEFNGLSTKARKATPRDQTSFLIPWMVEPASPEQRKALFRSAPPLRIVYWLSRRGYRREDEALLPAA